jgi:hypothetical protein
MENETGTPATGQPAVPAVPAVPAAPATPPSPADTQPGQNGDKGEEGQYPWLKDRLERAKRQQREELLKSLGFEDPDSLKTFVAEGRKLQEARLSESEKLTKAIQERDTKLAALQKQYEEAVEARLRDKRDTAIRDAASKIKAEHPEDVLNWILLSGNSAGLVDKDCNVDDKAVLAQVETCRKERPTWFAGRSPGVHSSKDGTPPDSKTERMKTLGTKPLVRF